MNCAACGQPLLEGANFCQYCGTSVPREDVQDHENHPLNESPQNIADFEEEALWRMFIGAKADYYFRKWGFQQGTSTKQLSWNWAAFFLGFFWAGYRKMYRIILIFIGVFLAVDVLTLVFNLDQNLVDLIDRGIGMGTAVTFGFYGNYFYYVHTKRKISQLKNSPSFGRRSVVEAGGTSGLGVLISIGLFIAYIVCYSLFSIIFSNLHPQPIEFGYHAIDGEIVDVSTEFTPDDMIHFAFYFPDYTGSEFTIVIEKVEGNTTYIYDYWEEYAPPDWAGFSSAIFAPYEEGEYIMKIIVDDEILAEGTFTIVDPYYDVENLDSI